MEPSLVIASSLNHDGDGLVRISVAATSEAFHAETSAWGNAEQISVLAASLVGFPQSRTDTVRYNFGGAMSGFCDLEFFCLDGLLHTAVKVTIVASDAFRSTQRYESAELLIRIEPSAIDQFVASLHAFYPGQANKAVLVGVPQYHRNAL